jgi:hypothetical protein
MLRRRHDDRAGARRTAGADEQRDVARRLVEQFRVELGAGEVAEHELRGFLGGHACEVARGSGRGEGRRPRGDLPGEEPLAAGAERGGGVAKLGGRDHGGDDELSLAGQRRRDGEQGVEARQAAHGDDYRPRPRAPVRAGARQLGDVERRIVLQDRPLQASQLVAGLEPQLLRQDLARAAVCVERLGLSPAAVQREHELPVEPLAQRVPADERSKLGHQNVVMPGGEIGVDPSLERGPAQLLEPRNLRLGERLEGEVAQRRPRHSANASRSSCDAVPGSACSAAATSPSARATSSSEASARNAYPGGAVTTRSSPRSLRSRET